MRLATLTTVTATGLAIAALSLTGAVQAGTGWQLIAKAVDRNSSTPSASIIAEELKRYDRPARIVTQSTRRSNKLKWKITCYRYDLPDGLDGPASNAGTYTSRGVRWPGRGTNSYSVPLPAMPPTVRVETVPGRSRPIVRFVATVDCYATVYFDAPWGKVRTLGVWLLESTTP
jgi:hypothetical protein